MVVIDERFNYISNEHLEQKGSGKKQPENNKKINKNWDHFYTKPRELMKATPFIF